MLPLPEAVPVPHLDLGAAGGALQGGRRGRQGQPRGRPGAVHAGVLGPRRTHAPRCAQELSALQGINMKGILSRGRHCIVLCLMCMAKELLDFEGLAFPWIIGFFSKSPLINPSSELSRRPSAGTKFSFTSTSSMSFDSGQSPIVFYDDAPSTISETSLLML